MKSEELTLIIITKVFMENMGKPLDEISAILSSRHGIRRTPQELRALLSPYESAPNRGLFGPTRSKCRR